MSFQFVSHRGPAGYKTLLKWFNLRGFNEGISYRGVDELREAYEGLGQQEAVATSRSQGARGGK